MRCRRLIPVILAAAAAAAAPSPAQRLPGQTGRGFDLSVGQSLDEQGRVLLVLSTSISHRRLVFFRVPGGYEARYRIFIDLRDGDGARVSGEVEEETVSVPEYEMTRSPRLVSSLRATIPVEPGIYTARVAIEVIGTSLRYEREVKAEVFGREEGVLEITRPAFSMPSAGRAGDRPPAGELVWSYCGGAVPEGFTALPGGAFADPERWIRMGIAVVVPAGETPDSPIEISLKVSSGDRPMVRYGRFLASADASGRAIVCVDLNVDDLPIGRYEVQAAAGILRSPGKAVDRGTFTVLLSRAMFAERFEETLELLSYIAEDRELDALRSVPPDSRQDAWERFWDERDPSPGRVFAGDYEEFLQRLTVALERFGRYGPGWKTDPGRVYIRYGPPDDEVDRDGPTLGTRLKIWYYYSRGIVFIFEDPIGAGRYRLMDTRSI